MEKRVLLVFLAVMVGAASLGLGLGGGYTIMHHFLYEETDVAEPAAPPVATTLTTVRIHPLASPVDTGASFADIIPQVKDAVVSIRVVTTAAGGRREAPGSGSGFIFAACDEYVFVATNNHVIENTTRIYISLDDNENVPAEIVGTDRTSDLAVIAARIEYLEEAGKSWAVASFGDSGEMRRGDPVVAIGNAMGEGQTVTQGIISALDLTITINDPGMAYRLTLDVLQTDAAVNRGNSGGPLVNIRGEVVGIVTAKLLGADIEGMGYAMPASDVYGILRQLQLEGSVRQAFIGIQHEEITEMRRRLFNLPATGMLIFHVLPDSPAEDAGLEMGDLIVYINNHRTGDLMSFLEVWATLRPGETAVFTVYRAGTRINVNVTLGTARR